jgi:hypothetical protein
MYLAKWSPDAAHLRHDLDGDFTLVEFARK